jgi:hypothetical protein
MQDSMFKNSVDIGGRNRQGMAPARVTFKSDMSLDDFDTVAVC